MSHVPCTSKSGIANEHDLHGNFGQVHEVTPPDEVPVNEEDPLQDGPPQNGLPAPPLGGSGGNAGLPPAAHAEGGTVGSGGGAAQVGQPPRAQDCAASETQPSCQDAVACVAADGSLIDLDSRHIHGWSMPQSDLLCTSVVHRHASSASSACCFVSDRWTTCQRSPHRRVCVARGRGPVASRAAR